jgi:hypothetical protein
MKYIAVYLFLISFLNLNTQESVSKFPEAYFGNYKGELIIINRNGTQTIDMEFNFKSTDSIGKYVYQIVYIIEGKREERNYNLITQDASKGDYIIDENNGILLTAKQIENRLYSVFEVNGNLLFTTETFYDDYMLFEIIFSNKKEKARSSAFVENQPEVLSYPVTVSQRAKLIKH